MVERQQPAVVIGGTEIAGRLRRLRELRGLTQEQLAAQLGVSFTTVNRWEQGRSQPRAAHRARVDQIIAAAGSAVPAGARSLPLPVSSFVGRAGELAELEEQLGRGRLHTLTGPGGSGKSRLALELARRAVGRFADGAVLVALAGLASASFVESAVAGALGLHVASHRSPRAALVQALQGRRLLLVLDNCEHLVDAVVELALALLPACPELRILATSRETLSIAGELVRPVAPLTLPAPAATSAAAISASEAVQRFVQRARERTPTFKLTDENAAAIAALCRRLDGLPLALELAAGWTRVQAPIEIAAALDRRLALPPARGRDLPPRHRSLDAAMDWSYTLLDREERQLFLRLAVFTQGFDTEAAAAVAADGGCGAEEALAVLDRLVAKSLVVASAVSAGRRFSLLETVRGYALERLRREGDADAAERRHAEYFLDLAERAAPQFNRPGASGSWLSRLEREQDNLRAALSWFDRTGDGERYLRLCGSLGRFYDMRGLLAEGRAALSRGFALSREPTQPRLRALGWAGLLAYRQGDVDAARALLDEALPLAERLGNPRWMAETLNSLGLVAHGKRDAAAATRYFSAALAIAREQQLLNDIPTLLTNLGLLASDGGEFTATDAYVADALVALCVGGSDWNLALLLHNMGHAARRRCALADVRSRHIAALALFAEYRSGQGAAECLAALAMTAACCGCWDAAARLLGACAAQFAATTGEISPSCKDEHA